MPSSLSARSLSIHRDGPSSVTPRERPKTMRTSLVNIEDARARLASGEQPYAFEISDSITMVGPACGFGTDYLSYLRTEGRYAETFDEAARFADARGATITGIWFVKPQQLKGT
jgi:hypothetical protein